MIVLNKVLNISYTPCMFSYFVCFQLPVRELQAPFAFFNSLLDISPKISTENAEKSGLHCFLGIGHCNRHLKKIFLP